jgi:GDP-4-dehydro-6-deoxy-D-mannose reductase
MRILIIGVKGFLGRYLCELAVAQGWEVHGLDISSSPPATDLKLASMRLGDFSAVETLSQAPELGVFDAMVHLAAPGRSEDFESVLVRAAADFDRFLCHVYQLGFKGHLIFASSSAIYGDGERVGREPFTETSPLHPETAYGRFKAACEELLVARFRGSGPAFTILRPFNLIGPRQPPSFFASNLMRQLVAIRTGFKAPVLDLGNTTAFRDFIDVRDVAAAILSLLALPGQGQIYNVASGQAQKLDHVIQKAQELLGLRVQRDAAQARPGDVVFQLGSSVKLETKTGWRPQVTLDQSLRDMMNYWLGNIEGAK